LSPERKFNATRALPIEPTSALVSDINIAKWLTVPRILSWLSEYFHLLSGCFGAIDWVCLVGVLLVD